MATSASRSSPGGRPSAARGASAVRRAGKRGGSGSGPRGAAPPPATSPINVHVGGAEAHGEAVPSSPATSASPATDEQPKALGAGSNSAAPDDKPGPAALSRPHSAGRVVQRAFDSYRQATQLEGAFEAATATFASLDPYRVPTRKPRTEAVEAMKAARTARAARRRPGSGSGPRRLKSLSGGSARSSGDELQQLERLRKWAASPIVSAKGKLRLSEADPTVLASSPAKELAPALLSEKFSKTRHLFEVDDAEGSQQRVESTLPSLSPPPMTRTGHGMTASTLSDTQLTSTATSAASIMSRPTLPSTFTVDGITPKVPDWDVEGGSNWKTHLNVRGFLETLAPRLDDFRFWRDRATATREVAQLLAEMSPMLPPGRARSLPPRWFEQAVYPARRIASGVSAARLAKPATAGADTGWGGTAFGPPPPQLPLSASLGPLYAGVGAALKRAQHVPPSETKVAPGVATLTQHRVRGMADDVAAAREAVGSPLRDASRARAADSDASDHEARASSPVRGTAAEPRALERYHAALIIQSTWRASVLRGQIWGEEGLFEHACAVRVQRTFRGMRGRRRFRIEWGARANRCATDIQRVVRGRIGRNRAKEAYRRYVVQCTTKIQAVVRGRLGRLEAAAWRFFVHNREATNIQRVARGWFGRRYVVYYFEHQARVHRDFLVASKFVRHARRALEVLRAPSATVLAALLVAARNAHRERALFHRLSDLAPDKAVEAAKKEAAQRQRAAVRLQAVVRAVHARRRFAVLAAHVARRGGDSGGPAGVGTGGAARQAWTEGDDAPVLGRRRRGGRRAAAEHKSPDEAAGAIQRIARGRRARARVGMLRRAMQIRMRARARGGSLRVKRNLRMFEAAGETDDSLGGIGARGVQEEGTDSESDGGGGGDTVSELVSRPSAAASHGHASRSFATADGRQLLSTGSRGKLPRNELEIRKASFRLQQQMERGQLSAPSATRTALARRLESGAEALSVDDDARDRELRGSTADSAIVGWPVLCDPWTMKFLLSPITWWAPKEYEAALLKGGMSGHVGSLVHGESAFQRLQRIKQQEVPDDDSSDDDPYAVARPAVRWTTATDRTRARAEKARRKRKLERLKRRKKRALRRAGRDVPDSDEEETERARRRGREVQYPKTSTFGGDPLLLYPFTRALPDGFHPEPDELRSVAPLLHTLVSWLAVCLHAAVKDYRRAEQAYRMALSWRPHDPILLTGLAILLQVRDGDFHEAVLLLEAARNEDPSGVAFRRVAAPLFFASAQQHPKSVHAQLNVAILLQSRLWMGAGLPRRERRYTQLRAHRFFMRAFRLLPPEKRRGSVVSAVTEATEADSAGEDDESSGSEREETAERAMRRAQKAAMRPLKPLPPPSSRVVSTVAYLGKFAEQTTRSLVLRAFELLPSFYTQKPVFLCDTLRRVGPHHIAIGVFLRGAHLICLGRAISNRDEFSARGGVAPLADGFVNASSHDLVAASMAQQQLIIPPERVDVSVLVLRIEEVGLTRDMIGYNPPLDSHMQPTLVGCATYQLPSLPEAHVRSVEEIAHSVMMRLKIVARPRVGNTEDLMRDRFALVDPIVQRQREAVKAKVKWRNALSFVQAVVRGISDRNKTNMIKKVGRERNRMEAAVKAAREERSKARLRKLFVIIGIQAMFRGKRMRREMKIKSEKVKLIQQRFREFLAYRHRREKDETEDGPPVELVYKRGRFITGEYFVLSMWKSGHNYLLHALQPLTCDEYKGLVKSQKVEELVREFPYGTAEVMEKDVYRTGSKQPVTMDDDARVRDVILSCVTLGDPIKGVGDLARTEGRYTLLCEPDVMRADTARYEAELGKRIAQRERRQNKVKKRERVREERRDIFRPLHTRDAPSSSSSEEEEETSSEESEVESDTSEEMWYYTPAKTMTRRYDDDARLLPDQPDVMEKYEKYVKWMQWKEEMAKVAEARRLSVGDL